MRAHWTRSSVDLCLHHPNEQLQPDADDTTKVGIAQEKHQNRTGWKGHTRRCCTGCQIRACAEQLLSHSSRTYLLRREKPQLGYKDSKTGKTGMSIMQISTRFMVQMNTAGETREGGRGRKVYSRNDVINQDGRAALYVTEGEWHDSRALLAHRWFPFV